MTRGGEDLKELAGRLLAGCADVWPVVVGPPGGWARADEATVAAACAAAEGAACVVTVGAGTLADIGKAVAVRLGGLPHVLVQTAASVNGYADDQSVLLSRGVKRTVPTRWPDVLVLDIPTLVAAPPAMSLAGLGDLVSMFTAPADWYLAAALGMGEPFAPTAVALAREHGDALLALAPDLARHDCEAVGGLATILTLSGISMGVAGRTTPSSGMEHTVSHLIEMANGQRGHASALHGARVGVTTIVATLTWRHMRRRIAEAGLGHMSTPSAAAMEPRVRAAFDPLDPSGAMGDECWSHYARKLARWQRRTGDLDTTWAVHEEAVAALLVEPERLVAALSAAGAPTRFADLDPPVDDATARWAVANCHLMRDRFTVADLAYFLGAWTDDDVDAVLAEAAALCEVPR